MTALAALDLIACPRLCAKLSREACYLRQLRCREATKKSGAYTWKPRPSPRDTYCASGDCGPGNINWRAFARGLLVLRPAREVPARFKRKKPVKYNEEDP